MQEKILRVAIAGFIGGVAWRSFIDLGWSFSLFLILLAVALGIYSQVLKNLRIDVGMLLLAIAILAAGLGAFRFDIAQLHQGNPFLEAKVDSSFIAEGVVVEEPDERENQTLLTVQFEKIGAEKINDKVLVGTARFPEFQYGDRVQIIGKLEKPKSFEMDTGKIFNYPAYLGKDGIFYQMSFANVKLLGSGGGNIVKRKLFAIKNAFLSRIEAVVPEPHVALMGGLLLGTKHSLGKELLDAFRRVGVIHIVVLSGYNITIIASALMWLLGKFLRKRWSIFFGALTILLFVIMVGASATAVRAGAMALLALLARATGRTSDVTRALILTGFLMLLQNPHILAFDPSFELSFLATLGLIYVSPVVERRLGFVPKHWGLKEIAIATISTQIFVLPFLLYQTGQFSIVSLPANLLILAFIPATMLFGFLTGIVGFISTILSMPFAFISYALLTYELKIVELFASLPFASVTLSYFPAWLMVLLYIALGAFLWLKTRQKTA